MPPVFGLKLASPFLECEEPVPRDGLRIALELIAGAFCERVELEDCEASTGAPAPWLFDVTLLEPSDRFEFSVAIALTMAETGRLC